MNRTFQARLTRPAQLENRPHAARYPHGTFQRLAVPSCAVCRGRVGGCKEIEEQCIGICCGAHFVVTQYKFPELVVVVGTTGSYSLTKPDGFLIGVGVKSGTRKAVITGPESGTAHLVRIRLPDNSVREANHPDGMTRRRPSREAGDGNVEAAAEEMDRTRLAKKATPKFLQYPVHLHERAPEAIRRCGIVMRMDAVLGNGTGSGTSVGDSLMDTETPAAAKRSRARP